MPAVRLRRFRTAGFSATDSGGDTDTSETIQDRVVAIADYALGPGINVDGEVGYAWNDSDPEFDENLDDYDALEIGIGTYIAF